ncbi:hypothetical protein GN109_12480 [Collimonas pratensis]|uniref:hypothetical protein n=1 Tax=Collimonas pratensis TaxID=279113 RepID=UPI00143DDA00|nr:hypothetical protein [Collimonas pratensis]NKI70235.1 hypothetical protein [Collimonas pratensis]
MNEQKIFVSVGATATDQQEAFVRAVESRLRSEGLVPLTVGRTKFSSDAPLKTITELLDSCVGTVIIALERSYFPAGIERRGGDKERQVMDVKLATPWNQIEAAMAYSRGLPLLVIVEQGLKMEGLLEAANGWYVQSVRPDPDALTTPEFNGILSSWKQKLSDHPSKANSIKNLGDLSVREIAGEMKSGQLWRMLAAIAALISGAFALGAKFFP